MSQHRELFNLFLRITWHRVNFVQTSIILRLNLDLAWNRMSKVPFAGISSHSKFIMTYHIQWLFNPGYVDIGDCEVPWYFPQANGAEFRTANYNPGMWKHSKVQSCWLSNCFSFWKDVYCCFSVLNFWKMFTKVQYGFFLQF